MYIRICFHISRKITRKMHFHLKFFVFFDIVETIVDKLHVYVVGCENCILYFETLVSSFVAPYG